MAARLRKPIVRKAGPEVVAACASLPERDEGLAVVDNRRREGESHLRARFPGMRV
jgi:hypothetical protein